MSAASLSDTGKEAVGGVEALRPDSRFILKERGVLDPLGPPPRPLTKLFLAQPSLVSPGKGPQGGSTTMTWQLGGVAATTKMGAEWRQRMWKMGDE